MPRFRDALESMVWQFAYRDTVDGKIALTTGGLSALEGAFSALEWDDPHFVDDGGCEIAGCGKWATSVGAYPRLLAKDSVAISMRGFGALCSDHWAEWNMTHSKIIPYDCGRVPENAPDTNT